MPPWAVVPYSISRLRKLLAEPFPDSIRALTDSVHDRYFEDYFAELRARSIVVERYYIDHDFLEDYAAYYVRCFEDYERRCTRLHFFDAAVDASRLSALLAGRGASSYEDLENAYLGFIVVRPVPQRPIGRTCLKTYPADGGARRYTNLRTYEANLFGMELHVDSLAFQEQDRTVAACATSALWSAFQGTGVLFGHGIPSPVAITAAATRRIPLDTRAMPASSGLSTEQMADAVRACDLEPLVIGATDPRILRAAVHAYAGACVPTVLIGDVLRQAQVRKKTVWESRGVHAVTLTGYGLGTGVGHELFSDAITKFYAHDDAVGPFARMEFVEHATSLLTTSMADRKANIGSLRFEPTLLLVPLYHKVRVSFDRVLQEVLALHPFIEGIARSGVADARAQFPEITWDVHLTTVNAYKKEIFGRQDVADRRRVLEMRMPRYLWLARATHADGTAFDLLFDATGIEVDNLCFALVERGSPVPESLRAVGVKPDQFVGAQGSAATILRARS